MRFRPFIPSFLMLATACSTAEAPTPPSTTKATTFEETNTKKKTSERTTTIGDGESPDLSDTELGKAKAGTETDDDESTETDTETGASTNRFTCDTVLRADRSVALTADVTVIIDLRADGECQQLKFEAATGKLTLKEKPDSTEMVVATLPAADFDARFLGSVASAKRGPDIVARTKATGEVKVTTFGSRYAETTLWTVYTKDVVWAGFTLTDENGDGLYDLRGDHAGLRDWLGFSTGTAFDIYAVWKPGEIASLAHPRWAVPTGTGKRVSIEFVPASGDVVMRTAFNAQPSVWAACFAPPTAWQAMTLADVSGDGKPDIVTRNPDNGNWPVLRIDGAATTNETRLIREVWGNFAPAPTTWTDIVVVDQNGDGKADVRARQTAPGTGVFAGISDGTKFNNVQVP